MKEKIATIAAHVLELFNKPTRKSVPLSKTIYPERKTPIVKTIAALINTPSSMNSSFVFLFSPTIPLNIPSLLKILMMTPPFQAKHLHGNIVYYTTAETLTKWCYFSKNLQESK